MKGYHKGIRDQVLEAMEAGVEMKTAEIVARVDGARQRVSSELQALVASAQIEKVRRGVYLKKDEDVFLRRRDGFVTR